MARHYSSKGFFRQMPNALLARYFQRLGLFGGMDFASLGEGVTFLTNSVDTTVSLVLLVLGDRRFGLSLTACGSGADIFQSVFFSGDRTCRTIPFS